MFSRRNERYRVSRTQNCTLSLRKHGNGRSADNMSRHYLIARRRVFWGILGHFGAHGATLEHFTYKTTVASEKAFFHTSLPTYFVFSFLKFDADDKIIIRVNDTGNNVHI